MRRILAIFLVCMLLISNVGYAASNVWDSETLETLEGINTENAESYINDPSKDDMTITKPEPEGPEVDSGSGIIATVIKLILWFMEWVFNSIGEAVALILPSITGIIFGTEKLLQINYFTLGSQTVDPSGELHSFSADMYGFVTKLYYAFNYFAIICFVVIIAYLAVRMLLSALGKQKAVYKALIKNWFVGILLLFVGPFIMAYTIWISNIMTLLIYNIAADMVKTESISTVTGVAAANIDGIIPGMAIAAGTSSLPIPLLGGFAAAASVLIYLGVVVLVFVTYLKRLLIITYLIILYPFITVTYVFDKMGDRKAQTFQKWFHEFAGNIFIQPFHALTLLLILTFISATPALYMIPILGAVCISALLIFLLKGEKLFKELFQLNTSMGGASLGQSMGDFARGVSTVNSLADLADKGSKASAGLKIAKNNRIKDLEGVGVLKKDSAGNVIKDRKGNPRIDKNAVKNLSTDDRAVYNKAQEDFAAAKRKNDAFKTGARTSAFAFGATGGQLATSLSIGRGVNDSIDKTLDPRLKAHELNKNFKAAEKFADLDFANMSTQEKSEVGAKMKALKIPEAEWSKMNPGQRKELVSALKDAEKARAILGEDAYKEHLSRLPLGDKGKFNRADGYYWTQDANHTYIHKASNDELVGINNEGNSSLKPEDYSKKHVISETDKERKGINEGIAENYARERLKGLEGEANYASSFNKIKNDKMDTLIKDETAALKGFGNLEKIIVSAPTIDGATKHNAPISMPVIKDLNDVRNNPNKYGFTSVDDSGATDDLATFAIGAMSSKDSIKVISSADSATADLKTAFVKEVIVKFKESHSAYQKLSDDQFSDTLKNDLTALLELEKLADSMEQDSKFICDLASKSGNMDKRVMVKLIHDNIGNPATTAFSTMANVVVPPGIFAAGEPLSMTVMDSGSVLVASLQEPEKFCTIQNSGYSSAEFTTTKFCGFVDGSGAVRISNENFGVANYKSVYTPPITGSLYYQLDENIGSSYSEILPGSAAATAIRANGGYDQVRVVREGDSQIIQEKNTGKVIYVQDGYTKISTPPQEIYFNQLGNIIALGTLEQQSYEGIRQSAVVKKKLDEAYARDHNGVYDVAQHAEAERLEAAINSIESARKSNQQNTYKKKKK